MKFVRLTAIGLAILALTLAAAVAGLWIWSGSETSLATVVNRVGPWLPANQTLEAQGVRGSLREGGQIDRLQWTQDGLTVEAQNVRIAVVWRALLERQLKLAPLSASVLRVDDRRAPAPDKPQPEPPAHLQLPLQLDIPFEIDMIEWVSPPVLQIKGLRGHYVFDSKLHILDVGQVHISSGSYQLKAQLQARAPMALNVTLTGQVDAPVPGSTTQVTVQAQAKLSGTLAGRQAQLALDAALTPSLTGEHPQALHATVSAQLRPWQTQILTLASAQWQALNVAALWPQAPQTLLSGQAQVTPDGDGWQATVKLTNQGDGPWSQQRLPLTQLNAQMAVMQGQWTLQSLQAKGAGGHLEALGHFDGAADDSGGSPGWRVQGSASGINPAAVDARLAAVRLDGQFVAQQTPKGIRFEGGLAPAARQPKSEDARLLAGFKLQSVQTIGIWQSPTLSLEQLDVTTGDARLSGQTTLNTTTWAVDGDLRLAMPGADVAIKGQLAQTQGQGQLGVQVKNARNATQWLARLPGVAPDLGQHQIQGEAALDLRWLGGWQKQGQDLQLTGALRSSELSWPAPAQGADERLVTRQTLIEVSGTLRDLRASLQSQIQQGPTHADVRTTLRAGRLSDTQWKGSLDSARITTELASQPGTWALALEAPVRFQWTQDRATQALSVSPGSLQLSGPVQGAPRINWQATQWSSHSGGPQPRIQWTTQGELVDLPLTWLERLGSTKLADLGLKGDLKLGGRWEASQSGDALKANATLERRQGDVQLLADDAGTRKLNAGLREARVSLNLNNEALTAQLRWDSERAGQVQAHLGTRLSLVQGAWTLTPQAPLTGALQAKLPPVGAWSMLAPPGWRLRGTLATQAVFSGTVSEPQWQGTLEAQDLAIRSVVDGIDFSQGSLRARLEGQRLEIEEFKLQGAGGDSGGQLRVSGSVRWRPESVRAASPAKRVRMDLTAEATALRLSARADRRLIASGKVTATLSDAKLIIRGKLTADQAVFILPEDSTPRLGDDVYIKRQNQAPPAAPAQAKAGVSVVPDVLITLDMGSNFSIRGHGLTTQLAGNLTLTSGPSTEQIPRLTGELRTVEGRYKAYGQNLVIETGVIRFAGPLNNPALDILAIRPNLQQRVGVQISGTALAPVVRLYAEPDLPDAEKLAWLVLGRSSANGGGESALLQQAALALLGGNGKSMSSSLAESLGLDEVSMSGATSGTASGATVTLGKRLSKDFYVSYESSLAGTMGTLYIFYDLSRRFTLRAQTGEQSAVDLIFTLRYD